MVHSRCRAGDHHCNGADNLHSAGRDYLKWGNDVEIWDIERISDELEEVINSSVFEPYSYEEEAIRSAMHALRWKAEKMSRASTRGGESS